MSRLMIVLLFLLSTPVLAETVTITASQDNTIFSEGVLSNGAGNHIFAGRTNQGDLRRALVAFKDLSAIPSDATIESVKLILQLNKGAPGTGTTMLQIHRLTSDWGEGSSNAPGNEGQGTSRTSGDATWVHSIFNSSTWSSEGGDFVNNASAQLQVGGFGSYSIGSTSTMVSDLQGWLDNPASNFGWIIRGDETMRSARRFGSNNQTSEGNRPAIEVVYSGGTSGGGFEIDAGIGGNWWNGLARNGEGVQVEVADDGNGGLIFVATIYSYAPNGGGQIFLIAVGAVEGDTAETVVFISEGGVWGDDFDPDQVEQPEWGVATFKATSCELMSMDLMPNADFRALGYTDLAYDLVPLTTRAIPCPYSEDN